MLGNCLQCNGHFFTCDLPAIILAQKVIVWLQLMYPALISQALKTLQLHPKPSCPPPFTWQVELDKERGRNLKDKQYNVRFYGNPGTGKTTVARMYAELLKEVGVLPGSAVVETNGAALVNGGLTELKKQLKELEKGGVLFVDEAYQIRPSKNPMGAQVRGTNEEAVHGHQQMRHTLRLWFCSVWYNE